MRFKIIFQHDPSSRFIPVDYQYFISAWIYKVLGSADPEFATFLHQQGYRDGAKSFKLFGYSSLVFSEKRFWKEKGLFELYTPEIRLQVGFYLPEAAEKFIIGLFNRRQGYFGDRFMGIHVEVTHIEKLPEPALSETMDYLATSPVVVSTKVPEKSTPVYLEPESPDYSSLMVSHLFQKELVTGLHQTVEPKPTILFNVTSKSKSKLVTIKPHTAEQTKVRGFLYSFMLQAPIEIHRLILGSGIGEKNSTGFGWCEVKENQFIDYV